SARLAESAEAQTPIVEGAYLPMPISLATASATANSAPFSDPVTLAFSSLGPSANGSASEAVAEPAPAERISPDGLVVGNAILEVAHEGNGQVAPAWESETL